MAKKSDRADDSDCLNPHSLSIAESGSSTTEASKEFPELIQQLAHINVSSSTRTNFVISTIAYVPECEFASDSSDEEKDGTFRNDWFNFDFTDVTSLPFTTTRSKYKRRKDRDFNSNFEELLDLEQNDYSDSKIVGPLLQKLSKNGFDFFDRHAATISASVALNRMKSLSSKKNKSLTSELQSRVTTSVRYEKFGFYWLCEWYDEKGNSVDYCTVRKFYKQLKRTDPEKAQKFLNLTEKNILVPYQKLREYAKNHDLTKKLIQEFRKKSPDANIYLSLIDSDTVDFNTIYSSYLRIIDKSLKHSSIPTVMSTGYEFPIDSRDGSVYQLATQIDRMVRVITARYIPLGVYYPEPNMCILIPHDQFTLPESFIDKRKNRGNLESVCLLKQIQQRKDASFIFSKDNPLITAIPDRAKLTKAHKTQITFSLEFKQGASPTKDDLKSLKQVAQSHFHEKVWYNNLFINDAIKLREYNPADYVSNTENLLYCENLLKTARNPGKNNDRKNAIAKLKQYMPSDVVEVMFKKNAFQYCIHLLAQFRKLPDNTEAKITILKLMQQYIAPDIVELIVQAAASVQKYVNESPMTYIRSSEETKLLEILKEYNIPVKSCSPDKLRMLAQQQVLELFENKSIDIESLIDLDMSVLEEILDEETIEALKNENIDFHILLNITEVPEHFSDYIDVRATGQYEIAEILEAYEENPLHLKFMAENDPNLVIYQNSDDYDIVEFGLRNYSNEIDIQWIRDELNDNRSEEKDCKAAVMDFDRILINLDYM